MHYTEICAIISIKMIEHLIKQYATFISSGALLANETLRIIDKHI